MPYGGRRYLECRGCGLSISFRLWRDAWRYWSARTVRGRYDLIRALVAGSSAGPASAT